jgi:hypothetical protein
VQNQELQARRKAIDEGAGSGPLLFDEPCDLDHASANPLTRITNPQAGLLRQTARTARKPLNATQPRAAIMPLSQQEKTMLKHDSENSAPEVLTDEQLEVVSAGLLIGPVWEVPGEPVPTQGLTRPGVYV